MTNSKSRVVRAPVAIGALAMLLPATKAAAFINVEFRPAFQSVPVGSTVNIGVYAVSDNASNQGFSAAQVILSWQPTYLHMLSNSTSGAISLLSSSFPSPDPYGLNESTLPGDGTAMYVALATFGSPAQATPAGSLLTTLRFTALAATGLTSISPTPTGGSPVGLTVVFDGTTPNTSVTGTLTGAGVQIVPAPSSLAALLTIGALARRRRRSEEVSRT